MDNSIAIEGMKEQVEWWQEQYEYWANSIGKDSAQAQHAKGAKTGYEGALQMLGVKDGE